MIVNMIPFIIDNLEETMGEVKTTVDSVESDISDIKYTVDTIGNR